jgi:DNA polymerase-1
MQQLPRDEDPDTKAAVYKACVRALPGRSLVKADYSQIELRLACKLAREPAMLQAYQRGEDLHTQTARLMLGKHDVTKDDRQIAKSANFGLLYGMGAPGYRAYAKATYGLDLGEEQAERYRGLFFRAYPKLAAWHADTRRLAVRETRTLVGRRRQLPPAAPDTWRLNTPVQGSGADGLKLALALLWERRAECPGAFPVLAVHDEIVVECDEGRAEQAKTWVTEAMLDAMGPIADPVPVAVDAAVKRTWG